MKEHKLSAKVNDKWVTFGSVKLNQWGKLQASLKVTPELLSFLDGKQWVNFAMFERDDKDKPQYLKEPDPIVYGNAAKPPQDLDDEIPF
jgi:hypothetical protein